MGAARRYQFMDAPGADPPPIKAGFRTTDNSLSKEVLGIEYTDSKFLVQLYLAFDCAEMVPCFHS